MSDSALINDKFQRIFRIVLPLSLLYISWIVFTGRLYLDDLGRSLYGYTSWGQDGRPASDLIMSALSFGAPIFDITPLPQILSVIVLSAALSLWGAKYLPKAGIAASVACVLYFILSPFFLENLSYRYDSLPMSLSLAALLLPYGLKNSFWSPFFHFISVFVSLSFYQASISLFILLLIVDVIHACPSKRDKGGLLYIIKQILVKALSLLAGFVFYKMVIAGSFASGSYSDEHSRIIKLDSTFFNVLYNNTTVIFSLLLNPLYKCSPFLFKFCALVLLASIIKISANSSALLKNKIINFLILFTLVVAGFFSCFAHIALLKTPVLAPRVMISFTGFFLLFSYLVVKAFDSKKSQLTLLTPVILFSFILSFSYANASSSQKELDKLISTSIYNDISHQDLTFKNVFIHGVMPISKQRALIVERLPIMNSLIPIYLNNNWSWGAMMLKHYLLDYNVETKIADPKKEICSLTPFSRSKDYSLYEKGDTLIVSFDKTGCR
ncbi:glucosyltransferase domain-containing protein [uncultured Pantoea sp.]|uniref:glucosyltransferase domain-containing protein n=1 Tax=uncultured Pantoea sp. TaxID=218084 RepID=UPI00258A9E15|nr:glucosyltransferase domain-containing protein [uncultured Pantoea sp.]